MMQSKKCVTAVGKYEALGPSWVWKTRRGKGFVRSYWETWCPSLAPFNLFQK